MPAFVIEYRSPTIQWDRLDHPTIEGLAAMRTSYVTLTENVEAETLDEAIEVAESAFGSALKQVYPKEKA